MNIPCRAISSEGRERCNLFIHPYARGYSRGESEVPCPGGPQVIADSPSSWGYEIIILALISRPWPREQEGVSKECA